MKESEFQERENIHKQICDNMHDLYVRKNRDYGSSVTDTYNKFGLTSFLVRISDKLNRVINLSQAKENLVKDEKVEDTLMDLANYAILALIELKMEEKQLCQEAINTDIKPPMSPKVFATLDDYSIGTNSPYDNISVKYEKGNK